MRAVALAVVALLLSPAPSRAERLPIRRYTMADGLSSARVLRIMQDRRGFLWLATHDGLDRFDGHRFVRIGKEEGLPSAAIADVIETEPGTYWVATGAGVARCQFTSPAATGGDPAARTQACSTYGLGSAPAVNHVLALYRDRAGRLWAGSEEGLFAKESTGPTGAFARVDRPASIAAGRVRDVRAFAEDSRGDLWIGTAGGLVRRSPGGEMVHYAVNPNRSHNARDAVFALLHDRHGRLWVGHSDGLAVLGPASAPELPAVNPFPRGAGVRRMRFGEGASRVDDRPFATLTWYEGAGDGAMVVGMVRGVCEASDGRVWIASMHGLIVLDGRVFVRWDRASGLGDDAILALHEDRDRNLWFGTDSAGAGDGHLWLGFYDGRLARYDPTTGRFHRLAMADDGALGLVRDLHVDDDGRLWVAGARGGVLRLDHPAAADPSPIRYGAATGLASDSVRAITSDRWGRVYIATVRGVDRVDPRTGAVRCYGPSEGLPDAEMNVAWRDRAGALWFRRCSSTRSSSGVSPGGWHCSASRRSPVWCCRPRPVRWRSGFSPFSFAPGVVLRYQHRLEGADAAWQPPGDDRRVTFAHLAPGRYRFVVRAVTSDGAASAIPASVEFEVLPPLWRRWWFQGACAASLVGAGWTFHRRRIARALEVERVRTRIASDLHDDIGSSLARLAIISDVVRRKLRSPEAEVRRLLEDMADLARRQIEALGDVVWAIDPRADDVGHLAARLNAFASQMLESRGIAYVFHAAPGADDRRLSADERRQILLVFKEAVTNVVRHAHCRSTSLTIAADARALRIDLEDGGQGFEPDGCGRPARGIGLASMRARVDAIGGALQIVSSPGHGTRVTVTLPWRRSMA